LNKVSATAGKATAASGIVRIVENRAGALAVGDVIRLSIPTADASFNAAATATLTNAGGAMTIDTNLANANPVGVGVGTPTTAPAGNVDGYSEISFEVITASTTSPAVIEITGIQLFIEEDAALGDVQIKIGGDASSQTLSFGTVKGFGYSVTAPETIEVMAGDDTETLKAFWLKENVEATIIGNGRTIKLDLPANTAWVQAPTMSVKKGAGLTFAAGVISTDRRTVTYTNTVGDFSTAAYEYKFEDAKIAVKATAAEGDVNVIFSGSSNVTGEIKVAEIKKPVQVVTTDADVVVGRQGQPIGDITIKEVKAGYIKANAANKAKKSALKTAMKKVFTAVANNNKEEATAALNVAFSKLDKAVVSGIYHKNYSRRQKARLAKAVNSLE
jgi:small subunit ribosomal protein S20